MQLSGVQGNLRECMEQVRLVLKNISHSSNESLTLITNICTFRGRVYLDAVLNTKRRLFLRKISLRILVNFHQKVNYVQFKLPGISEFRRITQY